MLVDPNGKRDDATIALSQWVPSPDGNLLAYALSDGGTDWNTWHFRRVADGTDLPVILKFSKFYAVSWARDSSGVYYGRYPLKPGQKVEEAERGDDAGRPDVYFHKLVDAQSADRLVYQVTDHPTRVPSGQVTEDGRYLIISLFDGYETNAIARAGPAQARREAAAAVHGLGCALQLHRLEGRRALFPDHQRCAPRARDRGRCATTRRPRNWRTVVPQGDIAMANASYIGGRVVVEYSRDARSVVRLFDVSGAQAGEVKLPGLGTATGVPGHGHAIREAFFSYSDYLSPTRIMRLDVASNTVSEFRKPNVPADFSPFVTEQVFYTSKDGTRVPMFITRRKDAPRDGNQPGDAVRLRRVQRHAVAVVQSVHPVAGSRWAASTPSPTCAAAANTARNGIRPARKLKKQNVFDDFIAAGRIPDPREVHQPEAPRDPRPQQRRLAGRRRAHAAAGTVRRGAARASASWTCCVITPPAPTRASGRATSESPKTPRSSRRCARTRPCTTSRPARVIRRRS